MKNYLEKYLKNDLIFLIILSTFLFKILVLFIIGVMRGERPEIY